MKKYVLAIAIASGAFFGLSAQAAPLSSSPAGLQNEVTGTAVKVFHCRALEWRLGMRRMARWSQPLLEPSPLGLVAPLVVFANCRNGPFGGRFHFVLNRAKD